MTTSTSIPFTVSVDTTTNPATYTIFDSQGKIVTKPTKVTSPNTVITYTLNSDSSDLSFIAPIVNGDPAHNLQVSIAKNGQTLTIIDSDGDAETICVQLVTVRTAAKMVSPDPQIKNRPGQN
ncbi:DP-EP family protein [Aestuariibacter sp. A3R04]|uniref:DP-EP family protein n=1 Tax=Aestuariibacter sp. A3R04 TaxID=2841571 RepID=UPI001C08320E|nr:DP-EP family protein [Aestuariibacter sp. A3R04]MBU3021162.1 DP-EP family protein [Aestuariibacter sp. A3R04]